MKLVTSESMRAIDAYTIEQIGVESLKLMESAGIGTVKFIERELSPVAGKRVSVVCGKGNNGGDGFVIARELKLRGAEVEVFLVGRSVDVTGDARVNLDRLGARTVVELAEAGALPNLVESMRKSDLIVDAVFGTGFEGAPRGLSGTVIGQMNLSCSPILAVDVPSGLNATTGCADGDCVHANWTCTMAFPKRGFFAGRGRRCIGVLEVVDIGVPAKAVEAVGVRDNVLTPREAAELMPTRPDDGHKGTFGKVVVVAGSVGYSGAAALTSMSAMRSGAGLVYLAVPESLNDVMEVKLTEVITIPVPETAKRSIAGGALAGIREMAKDADAVAIGPGISRNAETQTLVQQLVSDIDVPCVIDADGLNALTPGLVGSRSGNVSVVLTPHPGEMSRLTGYGVEDIQSRRDEVSREVAERERASVLLKGALSVTADPCGEIYINPTGNSALASGGTGDVLTGIVVALLARGLSGTEAAALAAYIHGLAGDLASAERGVAGTIASDVLDLVPRAIRDLEAARG
jgi:NAD(P)H-hydrate epimerase